MPQNMTCRGNMYAAKIWLTAVICLPQKYACRSIAVAAAEAEFKSVKPLKHSAKFGGENAAFYML